MHLTSLGGAYEIGASCHLLQLDGKNVVLDCGIRPGEHSDRLLPDLDRLEALTDGRVDLVLLSHAHFDHIGALPLLHSAYPDAPIYATQATALLAHVLLRDVVRSAGPVDAEEAPEFPACDASQVDATAAAIQELPFDEWVEPVDGVRVRFHPSGHVLGAAAILLEASEAKIVYSGDISATAHRMAAPMPPIDFFQPDVLILEGTHGDATHPGRKAQEQAFARAVAETVANGGTALVPVYPFGRAQEIILTLRTSMMTGLIRPFPIHVDGRVAEVCDAQEDLIDVLPEALRNFLLNSQQPLYWTEATGRYPALSCADGASRSDIFSEGPKCVITSSGRLTHGPAATYMRVLAADPRNVLFLNADADEEPAGPSLDNLESDGTLTMPDGEEIMVRCEVQRYRLPMHADQIQLCQHASYMDPASVVLVHGDPKALQTLRQKLMGKYPVFVPLNGDTFDPLAPASGPTDTASDTPEGNYDVRIVHDGEGVTFRLGRDVLRDRAWQQFFQGYEKVEAKFDGRRLRIKAIVDDDAN